jgi:acetoin utilization deacetylase AcuC-like enzyme
MAGESSHLRGALRNRWRQLRWLGRSRRLAVVHHPRYDDFPALLPVIDIHRARNVISYLAARRLILSREVLRPRAVTMRRLRRVHGDDYLQSLESPQSMIPIFGGEVPLQYHDTILSVHRRMVGGTLYAVTHALDTGTTALNLGGGFHHARKDRGAGFCIFNDLALAVDLARERGVRGPILIVDLDIHDGDGTRACFAEDASVHTYSVHNRDLDDRPALSSTSIALGEPVEDEQYLHAIEGSLPALLQSLRPELVLYVAGCDPANGDKLGTWNISSEGMLRRDKSVVGWIRELSPPPPIVVLLGGGYGAEAWRHTARFASWLAGGDGVIHPTPASKRALTQYQRMAGALIEGKPRRKKPAGLGFSLEPSDLPGGMLSGSPLLLGRYSRHAVEFGAERLGLLAALRRRGFTQLRFDFDLQNPAGETVRLLTGEEGEVLLELRLRIDRSVLAGENLLRIEWLLIQDPHRQFTKERPALPGQQHPGMGLLREVVSLLSLVCGDLDLDGLVFTPSHYHIAAQTERLFHFVDPQQEARFLDLKDALADKSLQEAIQIIERGKLVDTTTKEVFRWEPRPMLLATSHKLRHRLRRENFTRRVARARRPDRFVLA